MTREEAIAELQADKELYETDICHANDGTPDGRLLEALDMAIEALSADTVSREAYHNLVTASNDIDRALREYQAKEETDAVQDDVIKKPRTVRYKLHKPIEYVSIEFDEEETITHIDHYTACGERREP